MHAIGEFERLLGQPVREPDPAVLQATATRWGVDPPHEFLRLLTGYGDCEVSGFIVLFGPNLLGQAGEFFGPYLHDWETGQDSVPLLPAPGGMVLWGHTVEGDKLCLRRRSDGQWSVSVSLRNWYEWRHFDEEFTDWLYGALTGQSQTDWLPEWNPLPHKLTELGPDPFEE